MRRERAFPLLVAACCAALAGDCRADAGGGRPSSDAAGPVVGFDGVYRPGSWTPLVVPLPATPPAGGGTVHAWAEDPDGQFVRSPPAAVTTAADGTRLARFCLRFGRPTGRVLIEQAGVPGRTEWSLPPPIDSRETVILVIGDLPSAGRAARLLAREDGPRPRIVAAAGGGLLRGPGRSPRDFDGADAIVVCGTATAELDDDALAGIDGWVRRGGRLVFVAGASAAGMRRRGQPLADWLPGPVSRLVPLRRSGAIEAYARSSRPLERTAVAGVEIPLLENARTMAGSIEASAGTSDRDLPLVVRRAHGFGTISWIGIDLDRPPFREWQGTDTVLVELIGGRDAAGEQGRAGEPPRGTPDLAAQLRAAVDRFPGVAAVPFEIIAGLALLYVVCLYPLDWWLASGGGGRPWLAWISLPVLVAAAGGLAWGTAHRWKGSQPRSSRADMVDVDVASLGARGVSFAGIWSPINATLDVSAAPAAAGPPPAAADTAISWMAAAGRGLGATDAPLPHPSLAADDYGYDGSLDRLQAIPIAAASSRLFEADWTATVTASPVAASLGRDGQGTLRGSVTSRLAFPLEGCVLLHAGWLYDVGRLEPGGRYEPAAGRGPRSLAGAITRRAASSDRDVALRWDAAGTETDRILEIAGFHQAAGGSGYTGLEPGRLGRLDLSPLLRIDRAVLMGRGPCGTLWTGVAAPPSGGEATLWRIVIPLDGDGDTAPPDAAAHGENR